MKILAIIPARGGSKRLPKKNILELCGKPLIQWTIDAALDCPDIDTIMVSTDCVEIADIAKKGGVQVPFLRSELLSNDTATSVDVVLDVLKFYRKENKIFDAVILLQPTSPLRTHRDISSAIQLYKEKKANAVVSVCECEHSPLWCNTLPHDLSMDNFIPDEIKKIRSQDLPLYYRINGAIYLIKSKSFLLNKSFIPDNSYSMVMSRDNSIDIDSHNDFLLAEIIKNNLITTI